MKNRYKVYVKQNSFYGHYATKKDALRASRKQILKSAKLDKLRHNEDVWIECTITDWKKFRQTSYTLYAYSMYGVTKIESRKKELKNDIK